MQVDDEWFVVANPAINSGELNRNKPANERQVLSGEDVRRFIRTWFAPRFDEITLYVLSLSFISLALYNPTLRDVLKAIFWNPDLAFHDVFTLSLVGIPFIAGLLLPIYHAMVDKPKKSWEKQVMLFAAFLIFTQTGLLASIYLKNLSEPGVHWVFPFWNFLSAFGLAVLYRLNVVDDSIVGDDDAGSIQVLVATIAVGVCTYFFSEVTRYHGAIALSATISFATTVSVAVDRIVYHTMNLEKA